MSSVDCLREFVSERLTAAAEEIFRVFKRTVIQYEEEIDRQRRLLDVVLHPEIKLHRIELPQQHVFKEDMEVPPDQQLCNQNWNSMLDQKDPEPQQITEIKKPEIKISGIELPQQNVCKEEDDLSDQQAFNQERNSSLDQEEPEPPQIKEEQEEVSTSQEGEQLELKREIDLFGSTSSSHEEGEPELLRDKWLLSDNHHSAENQDETDEEHESVRGSNSQPGTSNQLNQNNPSDNWCNSTSQTHLSIQADEKPYLCKICGKDFTCNSKLNLHMRTHTGERPHMCTICHKRFCDIAGLKRHSRIHTGEKPYPCEICGKDFRHTSVLKVHMRIHTGERPYICNTCGKGFCVLSSLTRHSKTCGIAFEQRDAWNIQIGSNTRERPYVCKTCGRDFAQVSNLLVHMNTHVSEKTQHSWP